MNIKDCYPMRKRRSVDKTPGRSTNNDGRLYTPRRITSNHVLAEQGLDVIWDNSSPSPSRTLQLGKRKKHVGSDSSSSGGEISDLVKKLADKTGQTPTNNSLLNYWLEEDSHSDAAAGVNKHEGEKVKSVNKKKSQLKTPCRRPRELRKSRRNKNKLSKELEKLASMMQVSENVSTNPSVSADQSSSIVVKPINKDNTTFKSPTRNSNKNTDKKCTPTSTKLKSPPLPSVDDFDDFYWEDEEGDVMLSQVDISAFCDENNKDEVCTNTKLVDKHERSYESPNGKLEKDAEDENLDVVETSFVTESWDFDDDLGDEDNLLQSLDEVERTQSIISNIPSTSQTIISTSQTIKVEKNVFEKKTPKLESSQSKCSYVYPKKESAIKYGENKIHSVTNGHTPSKCKPLHTKEKTIIYSKPKSNTLQVRDGNLKVEPAQSKHLYSKEEIERKKIQAQQKLKQRQKQKSQTAKLNIYRSRKS